MFSLCQADSQNSAWQSSRYDAASILLLVAALSLSSAVAIGELRIRLVFWLAALFVVLLMSGRVYLRVLGFHRRMERSFIAALLAGTASFAFLVALVRLIFPIGLGLSTGCVVVGVGFLYWALRDSLGTWSVRRSTQRIELLTVALAVVAGVLYVQHYLPPTELDGDDVVFHPLRDFFTHANMANVLKLGGDATEVGRPGLAGVPPQFYHYAGYVFVALPSWLAGMPIYPLLMGLWTPLGLCLVGLASYALGSTVFGRHAGVWCVAAVIVLPDPSFWTFGFAEVGIHHYSLHRVLQIAPTNAFGLAVAASGVQLLLIGMRQKDLWAATAGWFTCGLSLYFKAQVFLAAFPVATVLLALAMARHSPRRRFPLYGAILALGVLAVWFLFPVIAPYAPDLASEPDPGGPLCQFLIAATRHDALVRPFAQFAQQAPYLLQIPLRATLILVVTFRLLLPIAVLALLVRHRWRRGGMDFDLAVAASLVIYLSYAMLIRPHKVEFAWGWPWNLQQVPFTWSHLVLATWTAGALARGMGNLWPRGYQAGGAWAPFLLAVPLVMGRNSLPDDWLRDQLWTHMPQPQALVKCAEFIRDHSVPRERFQDSEDDPYLFVEALSERRPFVGYTVVATYSGRDRVDPIFRERLAVHERMRQATSIDELSQWRRRTGVRWYLLEPQTPVCWPMESMPSPAFELDGYRVFDLGNLD